ncbi:SpoIIE family protein phosphatase [Ancylothrix sp. C2]|uniref:PP2C family protein-serine/threonine phosphatase n=1 Tax=Ancylothrix sp. D3o TaxID=2953691 RepID=UPI0021BB776A|nr:SpoIIE family protein phosphatase [Ancylothrix sp. D3o]MCT7950446.1 SpoIIE family protein phosphatase [Ancylothrix sp. D3o]
MTQILVIDDDPAIRLVLTKALKKQGYEVAVAKDGKEGISQAELLRPALIISDWMMPLMDGLEVCRWVKSNAELSTTFFILLTARGDVEDRVTGLDTGADEFLPKPIEIDELSARVRAGIRIHELNQDLQKKNQILEGLTQKLQSQNKILEADLADAALYVQSLVPPPMNGKAASIDWRFVPSQQLGGDCFDYYWLDDERLAIYLLDVSGHGVGAALLSVSMLNILRSRSLPNTNFYQPHEVLKALNKAFQMNHQLDHYVDKYFTIWYGVYHRSRRKLVYSSAGHPPAVLMSGNSATNFQVKKLKTQGFPIGMFPEAEYVFDSCDLTPGSSLYVFSDGIYELNLPDGNVWTLDDFIKQLVVNRQTEQASLDRLLDAVRRTGACETFEDDLSVVKVSFG